MIRERPLSMVGFLHEQKKNSGVRQPDPRSQQAAIVGSNVLVRFTIGTGKNRHVTTTRITREGC